MENTINLTIGSVNFPRTESEIWIIFTFIHKKTCLNLQTKHKWTSPDNQAGYPDLKKPEESKMNKEITLFLKQNRPEIITLALETIEKNKFDHYGKNERPQNAEKFSLLFDTMLICIENNNINAMIHYINKIARDRFLEDFILFEIQSAINSIEESAWKILEKKSFLYRVDAFRLISRITGIAKLTLSTHFEEFNENEDKLHSSRSIMHRH